MVWTLSDACEHTGQNVLSFFKTAGDYFNREADPQEDYERYVHKNTTPCYVSAWIDVLERRAQESPP